MAEFLSGREEAMRQSMPLWLLWGVLLLRAMPLAAHEAQTYFETGVRAFTAVSYTHLTLPTIYSV